MAALTLAAGCSMDSFRKETARQLSGEPETLRYADALNVPLDRMTRTPSGLLYLDREVGTGATAANGKTVSVGYVGSLVDGTVFDQSGPGDPIQFVLGRRQVIPG